MSTSRAWIPIAVVSLIFVFAAYWIAPRFRSAEMTAPTVLSIDAGSSSIDRPGSSPAMGAPTAADAGRSTPPPSGTLLLRGSWGSGPGQFGRRHQPESNPEAPAAIAIAPSGDVVILDQVNRRIQRFRDGKFVSELSIGSDTVQDLAFTPQGDPVLLDRLADRTVQLYDPSGRPLGQIPIVGKGIAEGGEVTGVFSDERGIYVERRHEVLVRIGDARGHSDPERSEIVGRPSRDGELLLRAAIARRELGEIQVSAFQRATGRSAWTCTLELGAPLLQIMMLDSDRKGRVYVAGDTGHEDTSPPYAILDETLFVVRLGPGGAVEGKLALPPPVGPEETVRTLTVDDGGRIFYMTKGAEGIAVWVYSF